MIPELPAPSDWLFLALVIALPLMKPAVAYPIVLPDLIFSLLLLAWPSEAASSADSSVGRQASFGVPVSLYFELRALPGCHS